MLLGKSVGMRPFSCQPRMTQIHKNHNPRSINPSSAACNITTADSGPYKFKIKSFDQIKIGDTISHFRMIDAGYSSEQVGIPWLSYFDMYKIVNKGNVKDEPLIREVGCIRMKYWPGVTHDDTCTITYLKERRTDLHQFEYLEGINLNTNQYLKHPTTKFFKHELIPPTYLIANATNPGKFIRSIDIPLKSIIWNLQDENYYRVQYYHSENVDPINSKHLWRSSYYTVFQVDPSSNGNFIDRDHETRILKEDFVEQTSFAVLDENIVLPNKL